MKQHSIHPGNFETFIDIYREELAKAHSAHPNEYVWPISELETVVERMRGAIERGTFNKDSRAFKAVCKQLGIKHTYKAIYEWLAI